MTRILLAVLTLGILVFAANPASHLYAASMAADSSRGVRVLQTLSCLQCHRINGKGGTGGPDLGWMIGRNFTPATLAAAMWNHAPAMWSAMRARNLAPGDLDEQAAADLFAYFYSVRFFEKPGDASRGKAAFESKGCSSCHGLLRANQASAKPVSEWESVSEPISLASAMWNHGARMAADVAKRRLKWPQLTSQDLTDLVIYLQGQHRKVAVSEHFELTSGADGDALFRAKGCAGCHVGTLALPPRLKGRTLTDVAAAMWNHQPRMSFTAPELTTTEMREIASYLWAAEFFEDSGNAAAGRQVFAEKRCVACHNAPKPNGRAFTGITMVTALWRCGPQMLGQTKALGVAWPRFEEEQMSNLIAFLNSDR